MIAESASISSKGQVTIPKTIREKLGLEQGSEVSFVLKDEGVTLLPKSDDPMKDMKDLKSKISFSEDEIDSMIKESKNAWD